MQKPEFIGRGLIMPPTPKIHSAAPTVEAIASKPPGEVCDKAGERFLDGARQIYTGEAYGQSHISIYYNADNIPLLFRKRHVSTALTLQPVTFVGVQTPLTPEPESPHRAPGTIVGVSPHTEVHLTASRRMPAGWTLDMLLVDGPLVIGPGPSLWSETSFSHTPFDTQTGGEPVLSETNPLINYFRAAALEAMILCEVL